MATRASPPGTNGSAKPGSPAWPPLVRLFPKLRFESELAYYVVYRPECASLPRLVAFRDWLMGEAASQGALPLK